MARKYDHEYKVQAVKLAKEIGGAKAAKELGIPEGTIHTWLKAVRAGTLDTLDNAYLAYPNLRGAILHSDRGTQYTSETYRKALAKYGIIQSMNSAGGRCHDNARCESMWARMKSELLYDRYNTETMTTEELKVLIWRYFISYWNNRRICSANGGLPPIIKRQRYYQSLDLAA